MSNIGLIEINGLDEMDDYDRRDVADWLISTAESIKASGPDNAPVLKAHFSIAEEEYQTV